VDPAAIPNIPEPKVLATPDGVAGGAGVVDVVVGVVGVGGVVVGVVDVGVVGVPPLVTGAVTFHWA
jgi:hypothetical protein